MFKKIFFLAIIFLTNIIALFPQDSLKSQIPPHMTAKKIIDNYIDAIGGMKNLLNVKDRTTFLRGSIMGRYVSITIYQKAPDKMKQVIDAGQFKQNIYFDGVKGVMEVGGKTIDVSGTELESIRYESMMYLLAEIDSLGIKLNIAGIDTVNDKQAYKIELIFPSGAKWLQSFDPVTWLKVKESKDVVTPQGTYTRDTYFNDYRDVDGIKYPFSVAQKLGAQQISYVVTSVKVNTNLNDDLFIIK